jgi:hypothetical protein
VIRNNITEIKPNAESDPAFLWQCIVAFGQRGLDVGGTTQGIQGRTEYGEHCIARVADDATTMTANDGGEYAETLLQPAQGRVLVLLRQAAESHDIGVQDCGEFSWQSVGIHGCPCCVYRWPYRKARKHLGH